MPLNISCSWNTHLNKSLVTYKCLQMKKRKSSLLDAEKGADPINVPQSTCFIRSIASKLAAEFPSNGGSKRQGHSRPCNTCNWKFKLRRVKHGKLSQWWDFHLKTGRGSSRPVCSGSVSATPSTDSGQAHSLSLVFWKLWNHFLQLCTCTVKKSMWCGKNIYSLSWFKLRVTFPVPNV